MLHPWHFGNTFSRGGADTFSWGTMDADRRDRRERVRRATLDSAFTQEELARVEALRATCEATHDCGEFGLDVRRLRYVRWLVAHGRIGEDA